MFFGWKPYVPVAERRRKAEREAAKRRGKGETLAPVVIRGRSIAQTFWGKSWCENLERYSDYSNRLPRGRTYVRNGSVIDLKITAGNATALVSGSSIYQVSAQINALAPTRWKALRKDCAGAIDTLVELLQARFSKGIMERMCRRDSGLFPSPEEIRFSCSCPDWADMCKHVAAVLYGVGARLDEQPELLFQLRNVDHSALIATAGKDLTIGGQTPKTSRVLDGSDLSALFGIDLATSAEDPAPTTAMTTAHPAARRAAKKKAAKRESITSGARGAAPKPRVAAKNRATAVKPKKASTAKPSKSSLAKAAGKRSRPK
jgi:uncharacterized Zn finger protein